MVRLRQSSNPPYSSRRRERQLALDDGPVPPDPITWLPFTLTAGTSIDWVGYVAEGYDLVNPAGAISNEPNTAYPLIILAYDPNELLIALGIDGDVTNDIAGVTINGTPLTLRVGPVFMDGETQVVYEAFEMIDGEEYNIAFISPSA